MPTGPQEWEVTVKLGTGWGTRGQVNPSNTVSLPQGSGNSQARSPSPREPLEVPVSILSGQAQRPVDSIP